MSLPNSPEWSRIEEVFLTAADLSGAARARFLDEACLGEQELRSEVESLLAAEESGRGRLTGAISDAAVSIGDDDLSGQRLGPWRLERVIGEGGMGSVYLGQRGDGQFEMRVAVKILRRGMESARLLAYLAYKFDITKGFKDQKGGLFNQGGSNGILASLAYAPRRGSK